MLEQELRIAATGASTAPGVQAALGQDLGPSSTTESPWRCGSNWIIWRAASSVNVLAFGLPGNDHALCALGHRLVEAGHSFSSLRPTACARTAGCQATWTLGDCARGQLRCSWTTWLPAPGRRRSEVLFTLIADGAAGHHVMGVGAHANPMATVRVVHHSVRSLTPQLPELPSRGQAEEVNPLIEC